MARKKAEGPSSKRKRKKSSGSSKGTRKPRSSAKRSRSKKSRKRRLTPGSRLFLQLSVPFLIGVLLGVFTLSWVVYRHAEAEVLQWLEPKSQSEAPIGRIFSAPIQIWSGLKTTPKEVALELQYAGYAHVQIPEKPGDIGIKSETLKVFSLSGQKEYTITFDSGRIASIRDTNGIVIRKEIELEPVELAELRGSENRSQRKIELVNLPQHIPRAILAMEDARFYEHEGVDPIGVARAVIVNVALGGKAQGASTITQQLVKNLILANSEKSYQRKAREAVRALALEQHLTKEQILETYLNEVYLGQAYGAAIVGVDQAARVYFGKPAERLSIGEAAMIGGMISAPNNYTPLRHPDKAKERRDITLRRMLDLDWITDSEYDSEVGRPLDTFVTPLARRAPYMVDAAIDRAEVELGEGSISHSGFHVHTHLQPMLQRLAEWSVSYSYQRLVKAYPKAEGANIGLVAIRNSDGAVVAMVGGRDYGKSQFNRALYAQRQIGSIVKPFSYAFAFNDNKQLHPGCWLKDEALKVTIDSKVWQPKNYDGRYLGHVQFRAALASSRNIPSVNLVQYMIDSTGHNDWLKNHVQRIGLDATHHISASLGAFEATPIQLAGAFTVFPNSGRYVRPAILQSVQSENGEDIYVEPTHSPKQVIDSQSAGMTLDMMREVIKSGTGRAASSFGALGAIAGKTGTTNDAHDAWFVGFDDTYTVAVWVGFDEGKSLGLTGGQAALPTWSRFMSGLGTRPDEFKLPSGLIRDEVCLELDTCGTTKQELMRNGSNVECKLFEEEPSFWEDGIIPKLWSGNEDEESSANSDKQDDGGIFPRLFRKRREK